MSTHKWPPPSGLTQAELRSLAQDHKDDIIAECLATIGALQADVAARDRVIERLRFHFEWIDHETSDIGTKWRRCHICRGYMPQAGNRSDDRRGHRADCVFWVPDDPNLGSR